MPIESPAPAYDGIAAWYDQTVRARALLAADAVIENALFALMGDLTGKYVCDLACGQGDLSRKMARRGSRVVGVDISENLLAIARRDEQAEPLGIVYHHGDAQNLPDLPGSPFDGVLCSMALMDIPDLQAAFFGAAHLLRANGWLVVCITHPCFQIPPDRNYHDEGFWRSDNPDGVRGKVGAHHRSLSTYLNALNDAGFSIERAIEPQLPHRPTPPVLLLRCRKTDD